MACGSGEGAGTSRSASSWYRADSSSSCRRSLTTSLLEAAPRAVPTHLYRKFCSKVGACGYAAACVDSPAPPADVAGAVRSPQDATTRSERLSSAQCLMSGWGLWLLRLPATSHQPHKAAHRLRQQMTQNQVTGTRT